MYLTHHSQIEEDQSVPIESESMRNQPFLNRGVLPSAIMAFLLNVIWGSLGAFFPLYALRHDVSNPGIFFAFIAITLILGRSLGGEYWICTREKSDHPLFHCYHYSIVLLTFSTTLLMLFLWRLLWNGWAFLYPSLSFTPLKVRDPPEVLRWVPSRHSLTWELDRSDDHGNDP